MRSNPVILARSIRAAVSDKRKELSGIRLIQFADADLLAGSIFASAELEKEIRAHAELSTTTQVTDPDQGDSVPPTRSVVRALFTDGALPHFCLTVPHLEEIHNLLHNIKISGGVDAFLSSRKNAIHNRYGLGQQAPDIKELKSLLTSLKNPDFDDEYKIEKLIQGLSASSFAALEAEATSHNLRTKGHLLSLLDLDTYPGESIEEVETDPRFQIIFDTMFRIRNKYHATRPIKYDAASLLAITRLWEQAVERGDDKIEYRFYTQTDTVRKVCNTPEGADLLINPAVNSPNVKSCMDAEDSGLRSSTYYIVRSTFDAIAFDNESKPENIQSELDHLLHLADTIQQSQLVEDKDEGCRLIHRQGTTLSRLAGRYQNKKWILNIVNRRRSSSVLRNLKKMDDEAITRLVDLVENKSDLIVRKVQSEIGSLQERIDESLQTSAAMLGTASLSKYIRPIPPNRNGVEYGLMRWVQEISDGVGYDAMKLMQKVLKYSTEPGKHPDEAQSAIKRLLELCRSYDRENIIASSAALLMLGLPEVPKDEIKNWRAIHSDEFDDLLDSLLLWSVSISEVPDWYELRRLSSLICSHLDQSIRAESGAHVASCWAIFYALYAIRKHEATCRIDTITRLKLAEAVYKSIVLRPDNLHDTDPIVEIVFSLIVLLESEIILLDRDVPNDLVSSQIAIDYLQNKGQSIYAKDALNWYQFAQSKKGDDGPAGRQASESLESYHAFHNKQIRTATLSDY